MGKPAKKQETKQTDRVKFNTRRHKKRARVFREHQEKIVDETVVNIVNNEVENSVNIQDGGNFVNSEIETASSRKVESIFAPKMDNGITGYRLVDIVDMEIKIV